MLCYFVIYLVARFLSVTIEQVYYRMKRTCKNLTAVYVLITLITQNGFAQQASIATNTDTTIVAGPEYKASSFYQWLWGSNYRKEWTTPVRVPVVSLDTLKGGLIPFKAGGGHQTTSLHAKTKEEKEYALRSVNKNLGAVLPQKFHGTFAENIVNDKVSMSHPYGAAGVPLMAEAANIYHTYPKYVYLPNQPALDTFNKRFGNKLYLFEQRLDGEWKDAPNLGSFDKYISTDKVREKLFDDNDNRVDQYAFIKARLFDMFINDWDRHEDQWRWGTVEEKNDVKIFKPVPQDRDQAFFKFNGVLLKFLIGASGQKYFQSFANTIPNVKWFNYEERDLDRLFANQMTLADWQNAATELQQSLTDSVIEQSIHQLPPEIYPISGPEIISKLKARRQNLPELATTYYRFIAREVDVVGSKKKERFEIKKLNENETSLNLYKIDKEGNEKKEPFYSRVFNADETKEIRVYGLSGKDVYDVSGDANNTIKIRIIGGTDEDSIIKASSTPGAVKVYDDRNNYFSSHSGLRLHLSNDSTIHNFTYRNYLYDKTGFKPTIFYSNEDRIFVGIGYGATHHEWRRLPFAYKHDFSVNYSLSQKAVSFIYRGLVPNFIGKWDFALFGTYDAVRWTNFFGLGNESLFAIKDINFYRTRTKEWQGSLGLVRKFGNSTFKVNGVYQSVQVLKDTSRYIVKQFLQRIPGSYNTRYYAGGDLQYLVHSLNDSIVPTKGFIFFAHTSYSQNIKETSKHVTDFLGDFQVYLPLFAKLSLSLRTGAETVVGKPEFYQYASIGGGQNLRGFRGNRFWGKTAFYNSNELRFISDVKNYFFNGKAGLVAFYDNGRVWMPGENSNTWHIGYGGGILLSPFKAIGGEVTYGFSKDGNIIQLRLSTKL
jgi:hypothetical protein